MNKKLIAVALAALPVAAMADVTLYGTLKGSVENDSLSQAASQNRVQDNTSIIGFKGTEDLGNGLKTVWQVENRIHLGDGGGDSLGSRQTFVGLDGGALGKVRIGYLNNTLNDNYAVDQWQYGSSYTPSIERTNGAVTKTDFSGIYGATGLGVFTNSGDRLKNAVRYDSDTFYGVSASMVYGLGENKVKDAAVDTTGAASNIFGFGLNYSYGDVSAHYAYNRENNPENATSSTSTDRATNGNNATKQLFEVDYSANNLFLSAAYQWSTGYDWVDDFAGDGQTYDATGLNGVQGKLKAKQAALSVAYTFGAFTPKFTYAKGWNLKQDGETIANSGYRQYILGVDYALSKRTTAGLSYGNLRFDQGTSVANSLNGTTDGSGSAVTLKSVALTLAHSF